MLLLGLLVVHDTVRSGQDNETELTGWEKVGGPFINLVDADVESWRDDTTLVQTTVQFNDDLASSVVIDDFEFTNVSVFHHNLKKLDDDLGGWSDQDLSLATLFSIADIFQSISQNIHANHGDKFFLSEFC